MATRASRVRARALERHRGQHRWRGHLRTGPRRLSASHRRRYPGGAQSWEGSTAMTKRTVIETSAEVMHGTPVFAGTRVPLKTLFDYLKSGDTLADFLDDFPTVSREQKVLELAEEDLIDAAVAGRVAAKEAQSSPRAS